MLSFSEFLAKDESSKLLDDAKSKTLSHPHNLADRIA